MAVAIAVAFTILVMWLLPKRPKKRQRPTRQEGIPTDVVGQPFRKAAYRETDVDYSGCPVCRYALGEFIEEFPPDRPVWGIWQCDGCNRPSLLARDDTIMDGVVRVPYLGETTLTEIEVLPHPFAGQRNWTFPSRPYIRFEEGPPPDSALPN